MTYSGGSSISLRWGRQLSDGGGGSPTHDFAKMSRKLREMERIWMPEGGGGSLAPLVSPLSPTSGGSKGGVRDTCPLPGHPNCFNFMQFLGEFGKIVCSRPYLEGSRPHLREILDPSLPTLITAQYSCEW